MAKPTELPKFADLDLVHPISGQPNVEIPDANHQDYGWDFQEKPARQHFNWLHRLTYNWLKWLDDNFEESPSGTITCLYENDDDGAPYDQVPFDVHWAVDVKKELCYFTIEKHNVTKTTAITDMLRIRPQTGNWPDNIIPATVVNPIHTPMMIQYEKFGLSSRACHAALFFNTDFDPTKQMFLEVYIDPTIITTFTLSANAFTTDGLVVVPHQVLIWSLK